MLIVAGTEDKVFPFDGFGTKDKFMGASPP